MADDGPLTAEQAAELRAEVQAYKSALTASQEEALAASAQAEEARAHAASLQAALSAEQERRETRRRTSQRILTGEGSVEELAGEDVGDLQVFAKRIAEQRHEIEALQAELDASNAKRSEAAQENAALTEQLTQVQRRLRETEVDLQDAHDKLALASEQLEAKERAVVAAERRLSTSSQAAEAAGAFYAGEVLGEVRSEASGASVGGTPRSGKRGGLSRQSSRGESVPKVGKMVHLFKEAGKIKESKISELTEALAAANAQLHAAQEEAAAREAQLQEAQRELAGAQEAVGAAREGAAAQLDALISQLKSKEVALESADVRCQALEAELRSASSKAASLQRQLELGEAESARLQESLSSLQAKHAALQQQLAAAQADLASAARAGEAARFDATQASAQAQAEHQRLLQLESVMTRLAEVLRRLLITCDCSFTGALDPATSVSCPRPSAGPAQQLEELVDVVGGELARRGREASQANARALDLEARLGMRAEEAASLHATLRAQSDKIMAQQSALSAAGEELRSLRQQLDAKEAQSRLVEAEIARQVDDFSRLKQRLLRQEELQALLAAKTDELAAANSRLGELELQLQRAVAVNADANQKLASMRSQADAAARAQAESVVQRQEALSALQVARSELDKLGCQLGMAQEAADKKGQEIRELNHMLKAWEAMRLGKDAQIAALMERCKRYEEEAGEKARTVEALRRKLALAGRPASSGDSLGGSASASAGGGFIGVGSPTASLTRPYSPYGGSLY